MKIGEFAKVCNTKISVLRHYDKERLLKPVFIDKFTGYRYYSQEQVKIFFRIAALKQADLSLAEIREIMSNVKDDAGVLAIFEQKKAELIATLHNLECAKEMVLGTNVKNQVVFEEKEEGLFAVCKNVNEENYNAICEQMDEAIAANDCQRISLVENCGETGMAVCRILRLKSEVSPLWEDVDLPFENDERIVGKWEVVGEYAFKEEFFEGRGCRRNWYYEYPNGIYFLPKGERYWCYGWTKGKLIIDTGDSSSVNDYEVKEIDGERYMFVSLKSYEYCRGGIPRILVLRQVDNVGYSAEGLARKDNIDMAFVEDKRILGKWKVFDFIQTKDDFSAQGSGEPPIFFKEIEFFEGGRCTSLYGEEIISGDEMQVWTKGYVLRKWNSSACVYEIRTVNGKDYLIMEWKSGDYRWGGFDTDYYVFIRDGN